MQFVLVPTKDRKDKMCASCGTRMNVKYQRKSDDKYFCSRCAMQFMAISDYMTMQYKPPDRG